jgi:hypothetical protein
MIRLCHSAFVIRLLVAALALEACTREPRHGKSSGADAAGALQLIPLLTLTGDTATGSPEFLHLVAAVRLANGAIAVADAGRPAVLWFDAAGRFVRSVGRRGAGPGEFERPGWLFTCQEDSLYVWDSALGRITVMDSAGRTSREFRLPSPPYRLTCAPGSPLAVLNQPRIIEPMAPDGRALRRYIGQLWLATADGRVAHVIGEFDLGENRPMGRLASVAVARDRIYVGTAESSVVDVYSFQGRHLGGMPVGLAPRTPTARDYERAIDRMVGGFTDRTFREQTKAQLLRIPPPDRLPPYGEIFSDADGTLWVITSAPADSLTRLRVLGPDGTLRGDVTLPAESKVLEVESDYVLTLQTETSGEQRIVLYGVRRPGSTR